ncbi:MAG: hypothetical protein COA79_24940 [Planctomycetota bacterium]|nr:MAG: hypothetical protein COA79_24940 [Planctomycetota bacterium]
MNLETISLYSLAIASLPVLVVLIILIRWESNYWNTIYAMFRMVVQLLLVGYFLKYIFEANQSYLILAVLSIMLIASSWISLRTIKENKFKLFKYALISITIGGGLTLILITQVVLTLNPWFQPKFMIPIAGMIFANSMNSISLASDRIYVEIQQTQNYEKARFTAFTTSLIPITNSLFAVGLVSLPGMMTGQILSGVSPLIAVRYQIVVMFMLFGSAGMSSAIFLSLSKEIFTKKTEAT